MRSLEFVHLDEFLSLFLFFVALTYLKSRAQVFYRMFLSLCLFDVSHDY